MSEVKKNVKLCSKCKKIQPLYNFGSHVLAKGGLNPECKSCVAKRNKIYYEKRKAKKISNYKLNE